jgi:hypothetical protein
MRRTAVIKIPCYSSVVAMFAILGGYPACVQADANETYARARAALDKHDCATAVPLLIQTNEELSYPAKKQHRIMNAKEYETRDKINEQIHKCTKAKDPRATTYQVTTKVEMSGAGWCKEPPHDCKEQQKTTK